MPLLKTGLFGLLLFVCATRTSAQNVSVARDVNKISTSKKPELFHDLPNRMDVNTPLLASLLQKDVGTTVQVPLSGFMLTGVVVSKSSAAEQRYQTVVIKAMNRPGATFAVTSARKSDGSYQYSGHMLSLQNSDAYELVEEGGRFALQKKELSDLVSE
jgi:hypothetical protein